MNPEIVFSLAPTLLAGVLAGILALQCRRAWTAFLLAFLGTVVLTAALVTAADRLSIRTSGGATIAQAWHLHLMVSPVLGFAVGVVCAAWVGNRTPPTIRQ